MPQMVSRAGPHGVRYHLPIGTRQRFVRHSLVRPIHMLNPIILAIQPKHVLPGRITRGVQLVIMDIRKV